MSPTRGVTNTPPPPSVRASKRVETGFSPIAPTGGEGAARQHPQEGVKTFEDAVIAVPAKAGLGFTRCLLPASLQMMSRCSTTDKPLLARGHRCTGAPRQLASACHVDLRHPLTAPCRAAPASTAASHVSSHRAGLHHYQPSPTPDASRPPASPVAVGRRRPQPTTPVHGRRSPPSPLPNIGAGNTVSTQGDIYSYDILVLETVTGKRPSDKKFTQGLSLCESVRVGLHGKVMDIVDNKLCLGIDQHDPETTDDFSSKQKIDCLISLLRLGLSCSQEMPSSRLSTGEIIKELHAIKESLLLEIKDTEK
ncbi:hypothetical protein OsI_21784 [Oryza sativa Indica Group]|uniref:Uncharacterized protein n=1 Tax=Oryza sativa subsp. indica TaxID=39946 RepID=B8B371_ORYSI|nr:hypothetical protein OsI_21784 [Oryza sativa Indica Group]